MVTEKDLKVLPTSGLDKKRKDRSPLEIREVKVHRIIELYELVVKGENCTPADEKQFIDMVNRLTKKGLMTLIHHWSFIRPALEVTDIIRYTVR